MVLKNFGSTKAVQWLGSKSVWAGDEQILQASNARMKEIGFQLFYPTSYEAVYSTLRDSSV